MLLRYLCRLALFFATFIVANYLTFATYSVVQFFSPPDTITLSCEQFCLLPKAKALLAGSPQGNVEVTYVGRKQDSHGVIFQAKVTNNSPFPIYYWDYSGENNPSYRVMVNGEIGTQMGICGTGLGQYHLHPGESMTATIPSYAIGKEMEDDSELDKEIKFGFLYSKTAKGDSEIYWSDPLPTELKRQIISSQKSLN